MDARIPINGRHHGHVIEAPSNAVAANAASEPPSIETNASK
jgi:hypothetical protein